MGFRDPITSLRADQITPGTLPPGVELPAGQISAGTLNALVVAQALAAGVVDSTTIADGAIIARTIAASAIGADAIAANAITTTKIAAGAIDGKLITGATVRTAASGQRVIVYNAVGGGLIELWAGGPAGETPCLLYAVNEGATKALLLDSGATAANPNHAQVLLHPGTVDVLATEVNVGSTGLTSNVRVRGDRIDLAGAVYNASMVHWEWTGPSVNIGNATLWGTGTLTKDTVRSVGSGPTTDGGENIFPNIPGIYAVSFQPAFSTQLTGRVFAELWVNGATVARVTFSGEDTTIVTVPNLRALAGYAIRGIVYQASGATKTMTSSRVRLTLLERL